MISTITIKCPNCHRLANKHTDNKNIFISEVCSHCGYRCDIYKTGNKFNFNKDISSIRFNFVYDIYGNVDLFYKDGDIGSLTLTQEGVESFMDHLKKEQIYLSKANLRFYKDGEFKVINLIEYL